MIYNLTKKTRISKQTRRAVSIWERGRGMIGRRFDDFDAMVFDNCSSIHTFFMSIPLDVIFVDRSNRIVRTVESLKPWNPFCGEGKAWTVIELPEGTLKATCTECGDYVDLMAELSKDIMNELTKNSEKFIGSPETAISFKRTE